MNVYQIPGSFGNAYVMDNHIFSQSLATSLDSLSDSNPFAPLTSNLCLLKVSHRSQQSEILNTVDIASPIATSTPNSKVKRKHLTKVKANERITHLNIN